MFLSLTRPTTVVGAAFVAVLSLGFADAANAAPPPGMRWSDTVGLTSPRSPHQPARVVPVYSAPIYSAPQFTSYAPTIGSPVVVSTSPVPTAVIVPASAYSVVGRPAVSGQVIDVLGPAESAPDVLHHCR